MADSKCQFPIRVQVIVKKMKQPITTSTATKVNLDERIHLLSLQFFPEMKDGILTSLDIESRIKSICKSICMQQESEGKENEIGSIIITDIKRGCTCSDHKSLNLKDNMEERLIMFSHLEVQAIGSIGSYSKVVHKHTFEYGPAETMSSQQQLQLWQKYQKLFDSVLHLHVVPLSKLFVGSV